MDKYSIGEISKETNVTTRTLRYYEEIGLLQPSYVADSGYRYYSKGDVITLQQITTFKKLGFKLSEIKEVLNEEEQQIIQGLPTFEENDKRTKDWLQVLREIRERINEPVDSPEVQQLAEKVVGFSMHVFQEDEQLINKYWELIRPGEGEIVKVYGLDSETMKYIDEIVECYLKKEEDK
ncbi:MerR family transcriptional regulator [Bacillus wiedmannii]|uniref:MerR family transcriptional regulator n=1 Tax=Bacillus wiedmannii TaxID=1890302 RepID=UPI0021D3827E|nr:MerR family transcriptional regulator [Bacillus wiedmannii]MCU5094156.1 MerR family transcriptional regulator [Bacillus wiedmannii]